MSEEPKLLPDGLSPSAGFDIGDDGNPVLFDFGSWPDGRPGLGAREFIDGAWDPPKTPITLISAVSREEVEARVAERFASKAP